MARAFGAMDMEVTETTAARCELTDIESCCSQETVLAEYSVKTYAHAIMGSQRSVQHSFRGFFFTLRSVGDRRLFAASSTLEIP